MRLFSWVDCVLKFLQSVAIVGAAIWTFYLYIQFDKNLSQARLEALRLGVEQQHLELAVMKSRRVGFTQEVEVEDLGEPCEVGQSLYAASFLYSITNMGQAKTEVRYVVARAYRAQLPYLDPNAAICINAVADEGDLDWTPLLSRGWWYGPKLEKMPKYKFGKQEHPFQKGGGGTGVLNAGGSTCGGLTVLVRAGPEALIGFHVTVGFDDADQVEDRWYLKQWTHVASESRDVPQNTQERQL